MRLRYKIKNNEPTNKIQMLWIELSKEYKRGIGYYRKTDIEKIKTLFDIEDIERMMKKALSERRVSYWDAFIKITNEEIF